MNTHSQLRLPSHYKKQLGSVFINLPIRYTWVSVSITTFVLLITILILGLDWSEQYTIKGYITTDPAITRVYPSKPGIITEVYVHSGDKIDKNDRLGLVSTTQDNNDTSIGFDEYNILNLKEKYILKRIESKTKFLKKIHPLWVNQFVSTITYQKYQDELYDLKSALHQIQLELIRYKKARSYLIRSPIKGTVADILVQPGDWLHPSKTVLKIIPESAHWIATLFIPANKIGFIKTGDRISIQHDAFSRQQLGSENAVINRISKTVLTDTEDNNPIRIGSPYYKASAVFTERFKKPYGLILHYGMTFSATVSGNKKKVWQWILDPLGG